MHHVVLERWSRGRSFLHARDPRAKSVAAAVFLIVLATAHERLAVLAPALLALLLAGVRLARLPAGATLRRAAVVVPFCLAFAAISAFSGDTARAASLLIKSYLSALAVLLLVATTPMPQLLRGLESFGVPSFLLMVVQFLYRYLFVIVEQAQHMRLAALSRRGRGPRGPLFRAAAGALAGLFARSYARAERIHRSMLARGFAGHFPVLLEPHFHRADYAFVAVATALPVAARFL